MYLPLQRHILSIINSTTLSALARHSFTVSLHEQGPGRRGKSWDTISANATAWLSKRQRLCLLEGQEHIPDVHGVLLAPPALCVQRVSLVFHIICQVDAHVKAKLTSAKQRQAMAHPGWGCFWIKAAWWHATGCKMWRKDEKERDKMVRPSKIGAERKSLVTVRSAMCERAFSLYLHRRVEQVGPGALRPAWKIRRCT